MTKTRRKTTTKPASRDRIVYEVQYSNGSRQVEATTVSELKAALAPLLGLDPYSLQATAHLVHVERATVNGQGWGIRRLGSMVFQADPVPVASRAAKKAQSDQLEPTPAPQKDSAPPSETPDTQPAPTPPPTPAPAAPLEAEQTGREPSLF